MVKGLENEFGNLITNLDEISKMATNYFKDLFSSKEVSNCDRLLASFSPCITEKLNRDLMAKFKVEEVVVAIKSIAPLKASGKDDWHIVGDEVTRYCLDILNNQRNVEEINKTSIVLVPKVLNYCIEDTQWVFVPGRQITDNIFVAYEILYSFKKRRGTSKKGFALKLDMSKAYDKIEWSFLEKMMRRMGFCKD
ncbi:reverse transcriptase [Gossypium australe]|uniref:Reverse transcriptase n=1 Tax=Gossypium australe TaxID=47621 RepID=A0A5B6WF66_9ROSI|nr:reverse transcriptase [Gossypium australe]